IVAFADDVTVLVGFRCKVRLSAEEVQDLCQYELTRAFAYTALRMDPSKCQSLTNLRSASEGEGKELRILGVWLNRNDTWIKHLTERIEKSKKIGFALARFARSSFGIGPACILELYRRVMLPVVSYAIEFWGPSLANVSYKRMVNRLGNMAIRTAFRLGKSFPQHLSRTLADCGATSTELLNLAIERQLHREYSVGPRGKALERKWAQELRERRVDAMAHHEILGRSTPPTEIRAQVRILEKEEAIVAEQGLRSQLVRVYTDGSRKPPEENLNSAPSTEETIGSAAIIYLGERKSVLRARLPPSSTTYQAEQYALVLALGFLIKDAATLPDSTAYLFSDCRSALQSLSTQNRDHWTQTILGRIQALQILGIDCAFVWIPSHQPEGTIPGNDEADQRANEARLIPNSQMARDVPIP
ncbi:hypothetical protein FOZ62_010001, partial [Perkinsus olseni]